MRNDPNFVPVPFSFEFRGKECKGKVYKTGKGTYTAYGDYDEKSVQGQAGKTEQKAIEMLKSKLKYSQTDD